jgi:hypothetical protein
MKQSKQGGDQTDHPPEFFLESITGTAPPEQRREQ